MKRWIASAAGLLVLAACAHHEGSGALTTGDDGATAAIDGEAAYLQHCAGCHETGMLGAPREGHPQDWRDRSDLWQAVLVEHAKTGYLDMPARGGNSDLTDETVAAATEYLLEKTFSNRQED